MIMLLVLFTHQYGFRESLSTTNTMFSELNYVSRALDGGGHVYGLFLGLSKAFDVVDHALVLQNLEL